LNALARKVEQPHLHVFAALVAGGGGALTDFPCGRLAGGGEAGVEGLVLPSAWAFFRSSCLANSSKALEVVGVVLFGASGFLGGGADTRWAVVEEELDVGVVLGFVFLIESL